MHASPSENVAQPPLRPAPGRADFAQIYRKNAAFVWRSLRRLGVGPAHLEDVCQEVFIVVHKKLDQFDGSSERGWLFAIALRVAADHRKRAHRRHERPEADLDAEAVSAPQHAELERARARELLQRLLDDLDEDKRAVFVLYELEGLPMNEIATAIGCPLQTAYSRLRGARQKVRDALEREKLRGQWP